jgi:hypothetical protein
MISTLIALIASSMGVLYARCCSGSMDTAMGEASIEQRRGALNAEDIDVLRGAQDKEQAMKTFHRVDRPAMTGCGVH